MTFYWQVVVCSDSLTFLFTSYISMAFPGSVVLEKDVNNYLSPTCTNDSKNSS